MEWQNDYDGPHKVAGMSLGTDLLDLRRNKTSTVATLLSGMERLATARSETTLMTRAFALNELADAVLAQVAVHALDACWDDVPPLHRAGDFVKRMPGSCTSGGCLPRPGPSLTILPDGVSL